MTPDDLDRTLADWLQDGAYDAPDAPIDAAVQHARSHPRRPAPFAFLRKDAMTNSRTIFGLSPLVAAVLAIVVVVGGVAAGSALLRATTPLAPTPAPSSSAIAQATIAPTPAPTPVPTVAPSSAPFVRQDEPGTAIPDSMLGAWYVTSGPAFPWIYRAGSPFCVQVLSSDQDCMAWQQPDGRTTYGGVLTIINDKLAIRYLNGSGCRNAQGLYHFTVTATTLTLIDDASGTCGSGDYHFTRAGTGSAPTSPPEPQP